jgi:VCBS repeat-containing protein
MQINVSFDQSQSSLPTGFVSAVNYVVSTFDTLFTANVTINIDVGYGEIAGQALGTNALGESYAPQYVLENYASVRSALITQGAPGAATLPINSPLSGSLYMPQAEAQALGLTAAVSTSYVGFSSSLPMSYAINATPAANQFYFVGIVEHEITEVMGRVSLLDGQSHSSPYYSTMDLFRYSAAGVRDLATGGQGSVAYFSTNGGATDLGVWNNNPNNGDLGDWYPQGPASGGYDSFNDYSYPGVINALSGNDITLMEALGWSTNVILVTATSSQAVQGGSAVTLLAGSPIIIDSGQTALTTATIKITNGSGGAVAGDELYLNGQQSGAVSGVTISWNDTTKILTLSGNASIATYETLLSEISYKDTGTDTSGGSHPQRSVSWGINDGTNNYNATSQIAVDRVPVANNSFVTDVAGAPVTKTAATGVISNASDLDNDKLTVIGVSDAAHGMGVVGQSLAGVYGHLTLNSDGSYSYTGDIASAIATASSGSHLVDTFSYTISDGNGGTSGATLAVTLDRPPVVTVANVDLTAGHTSASSSSLFTAADADNDSIVTYGFVDSGPGELLLNGVAQAHNQEIDLTAGQLAQLVYQSAPQSVDTLAIRAFDGAGWSAWSTFTVTSPPVALQTDTNSFGTTSLTGVGYNYFLDNSSGLGPELTMFGAAFVVGEAGPWVPIGAVQTADGYDIAWKLPGSNLFTIWNLDASGNYVSDTIGAVAGNSATLQSFESVFNQDLNSDGAISPPTTIATDTGAYGTTSLTVVGIDYFLDGTSGTGPELTLNGAPLTVGQAGPWTPLGAVQTASGYDVAWELPGSNLFTVWSVDSGGHYVSDTIGAVAGNSATLESFEPIFNQDLNGDGTIGIPRILVHADSGAYGTTNFTEVGNDYFLYDSGGSGPELTLNAAPLTVGQAGPWIPIGAVETASGYDVAWELPGSDLFTVWIVDSGGHYVSDTIGAVAGNSATLESFESVFNQDLNNDGAVSPPATIAADTGAYGTTSLTVVGIDYFLDGGGGAGPELTLNGAPLTVGQAGPWTPIGAVQTASGYDMAWELPGSNLFTVWSIDAGGHYVSDTIGAVVTNSATLESFESIFNQDLNGDGVIGLYATPGSALRLDGAVSTGATIGPHATLEMTAADSAPVTFATTTGMLKLDAPSAFTSQIFNFAGNGTLSGSDQIDLTNINPSSVHDSYANGVLTVTDGTNTDQLLFSGSYVLANFKFASDGSSGTIVYDPPVSGSAVAANSAVHPGEGAAGNVASMSSAAGVVSFEAQDTFLFSPDLGHAGQASVESWAADALVLKQSELQDLAALLAATHGVSPVEGSMAEALHATTHALGTDQSHSGHLILV